MDMATVAWEALEPLPFIDSQSRKRTSCAEDHLVIEMPRKLDGDIWETLAKCFQLDGGR